MPFLSDDGSTELEPGAAKDLLLRLWSVSNGTAYQGLQAPAVQQGSSHGRKLCVCEYYEEEVVVEVVDYASNLRNLLRASQKSE